jgi:photosystem II biogenesis protein Psp29
MRPQAVAAANCRGKMTAQSRRTCSVFSSGSRQTNNSRISRLVVRAEGDYWNPPTVSATKEKFYVGYKKPMSAVYNTVVQELLVQQHLIRYNKNYQYDEVFALGFVSVFDQVLEGMPEDTDNIFRAYIGALDEDADKYRADADKLAGWAKELKSASELTPSEEGNDVQKLLAGIAARSKEGKFLYSKFFAIGLFRLLELTGAKEPQALSELVKAMHIRQEGVNRDLMTYKGVLSKLSAAKELMRDFIEREKRKQAERDAAKKEKSADIKDTPESRIAADPEKAKEKAV